MKVYIAATINTHVSSITDSDLIADILIITEDKTKARKIADHVKKRRHLPSLDYKLLAPFDTTIVFERDLEKIISNKETLM